MVESGDVVGEEKGEPIAHSWKQFSTSGAQCHHTQELQSGWLWTFGLGEP